MTWAQFIVYYAKWIMAIPLAIALLNHRRLDQVQRLTLMLVVLGIATEVAAYVVGTLRQNNLFLLHLFTVAEFILLATIYHKGYQHLISVRWYWVLIIVFVGLSLLNLLYWQGPNAYNSNGRALESILVTGLVILFFMQVLHRLDIANLSEYPLFWLSCGLLIFFPSNLLLFIFSDYIIERGQGSSQGSLQFFEIWAIHGIFNMLLYLFYARALLCRWTKPI
ncbi:MAG: hypothetical protein SF053_03690 [Bacteroidia bacterium]|nr:hypothetical protein [Bacteroidia bacterium]